MIMGTEPFVQTAMVVWSLIIGAVLCGIYDVFRVMRLRKKQNSILLFINDFSFCIIATVFMLLMFFNLSYGRVRAYAFLFVFIGFMVWRYTISRLYMAVISKILEITDKILTSIKIRVSPYVKKASRKIYKTCRKPFEKVKFGRKFKKRKEIENE